jgi:hypothetical protein
MKEKRIIQMEIDCPADASYEEIKEAVAEKASTLKCQHHLLETVKHLKETGQAKSDSAATKIIAGDTGETSEAVRQQHKRAKTKVGQVDQKSPEPKKEPPKKLPKLSEKQQKEEIAFWKGVQGDYPKIMGDLKEKIGKTIAGVAGELQDRITLRYKDHPLPDAKGEGMTELLARRICQAIRLIDPGVIITFGEEVEALTYSNKAKEGNPKRLKALEGVREDAGS